MKDRTPRNNFETKILKQLVNGNCRVKYESERIPYYIAGHYIPDYVVTTPTGKVYIEAKGHFRPEAKRKMVAVKQQHPEMDIRIVFYKYNIKYERWAKKHGFRYAFGDIPISWLEGF